MPVSANNFWGQWTWPVPDLQELFDFGMAEIGAFYVGENTTRLRELRALGKPQIFTYTTDELLALRPFIAHTYATVLEVPPVTPWGILVLERR